MGDQVPEVRDPSILEGKSSFPKEGRMVVMVVVEDISSLEGIVSFGHYFI
jgi:hypothetical protein